MISNVKLYFLSILSLFFVLSCRVDVKKTQEVETNYISVDKNIKGVEAIESFLKPYNDTVRTKLGKVLAYTPKNLMGPRGSLAYESELGNLLSDLIFEQANLRYQELYNSQADFAVLNRGGIRTNIPKGDISLHHMFEIMPFENTLLVVTIGPKKMKEMLKYMAESDGHPLSNIRLKIKNKHCYDIKIGGVDLDTSRSYRVVTSDYLQHGGDKMYFLSDPIDIDTLNYLMRDAMIDYFTKIDTVRVELDKRFEYEK